MLGLLKQDPVLFGLVLYFLALAIALLLFFKPWRKRAVTHVHVHAPAEDRHFEIVGGDKARDLPAAKPRNAASAKSAPKAYPAKPKSASRKKSGAKKPTRKKSS